MTTYEEWRVTGTWEDQPYTFTWSPTRGDADAELHARGFIGLVSEHGWTEGPHLHKRTVTVTDWEAVE